MRNFLLIHPQVFQGKLLLKKVVLLVAAVCQGLFKNLRTKNPDSTKTNHLEIHTPRAQAPDRWPPPISSAMFQVLILSVLKKGYKNQIIYSKNNSSTFKTTSIFRLLYFFRAKKNTQKTPVCLQSSKFVGPASGTTFSPPHPPFILRHRSPARHHCRRWDKRLRSLGRCNQHRSDLGVSHIYGGEPDKMVGKTPTNPWDFPNLKMITIWGFFSFGVVPPFKETPI